MCFVLISTNNFYVDIFVYIQTLMQTPISVSVSSDKFMLLTEKHAIPLPNPFDNKGNYVIR